MPRNAALYEELARYYDQIYHWKDYRAEARKLSSLVRKRKRSNGKDLLDVACGTGRHLSYLSGEFDCTGVDASRQMLSIARENAPRARFLEGKMTDFDAGMDFDVVLCLFSSIGYLRTRKETERALTNLARHVKQGGVLIIEPWLRKSEWKDRTVHMQTSDGPSVKIARLTYSHAEGDLSILDEGYLVAKKGEGVSFFKDRHRMRFFEVKPALRTLRRAGMEAAFTKDSLMPGRGLVVATKPLGQHRES